MKIKIFISFVLIIILNSCKKESQKIYSTTALNIVNAATNLPLISIDFTLTPVGFSQNYAKLPFGSYIEYGKPSGNFPLVMFSSLDTTSSFYNQNLNLRGGGIYSLYILGQNDPETMLLEDHIPSYQDSTSGVRFINLSSDSQPVTINLAGNPANQTEFTSLAYKQISAFKSYSAKSVNSAGYNFEVRDAATGNLLTTFAWNFKPFFCNTLVIDGLVNNGSGNFPVNVFQVNHY